MRNNNSDNQTIKQSIELSMNRVLVRQSFIDADEDPGSFLAMV